MLIVYVNIFIPSRKSSIICICNWKWNDWIEFFPGFNFFETNLRQIVYNINKSMLNVKKILW